MANTIWIARDKNGSLYLYSNKPKVDSKGIFYGESEQERIFITNNEFFEKIDPNWFPEVTFKNSPKELIIKD